MLPVQFRIDSFFYRDRFKIFFPHLLEKFFVFIHQLLTQKTGKQMCLLLFKANFDRFFSDHNNIRIHGACRRSAISGHRNGRSDKEVQAVIHYI